MAGPIISTGKPCREALWLIALVILACLFMTPEITDTMVKNAPWLAPLVPALRWLHHLLLGR